MGQARYGAPAQTIATKLAPPCPPVSPVRRERLFAALAHGTASGTTLVCAPAGSGKTALVASWLGSGGATWPTAWLSLDVRDDNRRAFWAGVLAALARADPDDAELAGLQLPPRGRIDRVFTALVERLAARSRPLVLVLDDVHELHDPAIEEDLTALLRHAPASLRLVLIARADPPLGLQRLRVSGRLTEIRARELAFDADEARALLERWGARLDAVEARELWRRSGGWAAGLVLPALALRGHDDPAAFVRGFGGRDRSVADFILTELLAEQPDDVRRFLLRTSIAEPLPVGLAAALSGRRDAAELLERLTRRNLLVTREGPDRYRYGPLLGELLRSEQTRTAPADASELHGCAARWHANAADPRAAIAHGVAAGAWELVAQTVSDSWQRLLLDGETALLRAATHALPASLLERWPQTALAAAAVCAEAGDEAGARGWVARADAVLAGLLRSGSDPFSPNSAAAPPTSAAFAPGRALVALLLGRIRGNVEQTARAGVELTRGRSHDDDPEIAAGLRILALVQLGAVEVWRGELEAGAPRLEAALAAARERGLDALVLSAQAQLALCDALAGRLVRAAEHAEQALALAERRGWERTPAAATAQAALAGVLLQWERTAAAERTLTRAERTVRVLGEPPLRAFVALQRIALLAADGSWDAAIAQLRAAQAELHGWPLAASLRARFVAYEAVLRAARGERAAADALLQRASADEPRPEHACARARLLLSAGEPAQASAALAGWLAGGDGARSVAVSRAVDDGATLRPIVVVSRPVAVELWATAAVACEALDDLPGACAALERALALAEPDGLRHELLLHAPAIRGPLRRTIRNGTAHRSFAGELLELLERDGVRPLALPEPLSEREEAVLRCLPTMMSNREIASELYVSVNTVKTHLKHIYRKLDAGDRRAAVRRARDLQLLSPPHEPLVTATALTAS